MSYLLNIKVDLFSIVDLLSVGLQVLLSQSTHIHPAVSACLTALPSALSTVGTRTNKAVLTPGLREHAFFVEWGQSSNRVHEKSWTG